MESRIVIGLGDDQFNELTKRALEEDGVGKVVGTALTRKNIIQRVMETTANMVFVAEQLIGEKGSDEEWIDIVEELRRLDMNIRIVFFCDRPEDDLFLTKLALLNVTDIFNEGKLMIGWSLQLKQPPKFEHTERFRKQSDPAMEELRKRKRKNEETPEEILQKTHTPQSDAPSVQSIEKTIEKIVEKRIIEKEIVIEQVKIPKRSIAVVSMFPGIGSSMLTRILAEYIAALDVDTGIVESPTSSSAWFEIINARSLLHEREKRVKELQDLMKKNQDPNLLAEDMLIYQSHFMKGKHEWVSWHQTIKHGEDAPAWADLIELNKVKFIIRSPRETLDDWLENDTAHLLAYSRNLSTLFYDLSGHYDDPREQIVLRSADHIIVVGGYDVIRMDREMEKYRQWLGKYQDKIIFVLNKTTPRMVRTHSSEMKTIYETKKLHHIPAMVEMFEVYLDGESFWKSSYIKEEQKQKMRDAMEVLTRDILGAEVMKKLITRKKGGILERVSAFFKMDEHEIDTDEGTA